MYTTSSFADGFAVSFWLFIPYTSVNNPVGQLQLMITYPQFFTFYALSGTYYLELYQLLTVSFSLDFSTGNWQNVGFTWNNNSQTLAVYTNGAAASTWTLPIGTIGDRVAALLARSSYCGATQCYLLGSGSSVGTGYNAPRNMILKDLVIWQRPFFSCDVNLFLGLTGTVHYTTVLH